MENINKSQKDKEQKDILLSQWLTNNNLGRCVVFNAKLTKRGCSALKAANKHKLDTLDYDDLQEADYQYCTGGCSGLKFNSDKN